MLTPVSLRVRSAMLTHTGPGWVINTDPGEFWANLYQWETSDVKPLTASVLRT